MLILLIVLSLQKSRLLLKIFGLLIQLVNKSHNYSTQRDLYLKIEKNAYLTGLYISKHADCRVKRLTIILGLYFFTSVKSKFVGFYSIVKLFKFYFLDIS
jgi:hypothetical protein